MGMYLSVVFCLDDFVCDIPEKQIVYMKNLEKDCRPTIGCHLYDPYSDSRVLAQSQCFRVNRIANFFFFLSWWKIFKRPWFRAYIFTDSGWHTRDVLVLSDHSIDRWYLSRFNNCAVEHGHHNCNTWNINWTIRNRSAIGLGCVGMVHFPINSCHLQHSWWYRVASHRMHCSMGHCCSNFIV